MTQHKVVVYETGSVNPLQIENLPNQDVHIQRGEMVRVGRQGRVLRDDIILPRASGKVTLRVKRRAWAIDATGR